MTVQMQIENVLLLDSGYVLCGFGSATTWVADSHRGDIFRLRKDIEMLVAL